MRFACLGATCLIFGPAAALAQEPQAQTIVVTAPGYPDDARPEAEVGADEIRGSGRPDLFGALVRNAPSVSLQEAQGNPFQPNLVYRGFTASPLQGQAQGLAVYLDGARFNQPFGDTVQFDLLPETAIYKINLLGPSPAYGLNALGGAITVETKTGRSAPGGFVSASMGSYGEVKADGEYGWRRGEGSLYVAVEHSRDGGWRRFSPSRLTNVFADAGWDGGRAGVHLKAVGADTDLTGNGSAPIELLNADDRAVFTHPDNTQNRFGRISLHPWIALGGHTRFEASLYVQKLRQRTVNGDLADIAACDDHDNAGLLCLASAAGDDEEVLTDSKGGVGDLIAGAPYGVLNRSRTDTRAGGVLTQLVDRRKLASGESVFVIGFSRDQSDTRFDSSTELGALNESRGVDGLGPIINQSDGTIAPVSLTARTRYSGIFVSERLPLLPSLWVEGGLRWNDARIDLHDHIGQALNGAHSFRRINPGVALQWQPRAGLTFHANYAESSRAPTPAELSCADAAAPCSLTNFFVGDPPLHQVVARSFEAGGRARLGGIEWQISAYRSTNGNDIQFVASDTRGRAFFRNIGNTRRQGLEAAATYQHGPLRLRAGYAFTDATFRSSLLLNASDNPRADDAGEIEVVPGNRLPGIPRHRATVSLNYEGERWAVGGDVQASSGLYLFGDEANLERRTDVYVLANLRASLRLVDRVSLFAELRNAFGTRYATFGTFSATNQVYLAEAPGAANPRSLGPGSPRRLTVGLSSRF